MKVSVIIGSVPIRDSLVRGLSAHEGIEAVGKFEPDADTVVSDEEDVIRSALERGKLAVQVICDSREQAPFAGLEEAYPGKVGCCLIFPSGVDGIVNCLRRFLGEEVEGRRYSCRPNGTNGHCAGIRR